ncbi:MAG: DUF1697 domain-containing protein [Nocardioides sp.]|nr:DUF1697 domain-containing protein [Nocardioides sp.]
MTTYVAFLRAINLGATRKFPRDAIVAAATGAGFSDVATHINTGNVLVRTARRSRGSVEKALEEAFAADRGFEVPTIVFTPAEVAGIVGDLAEVAREMPALGMHYVSLLKDEPDDDVRLEAEAASTDHERLVVRGRAAHLLLAERDAYHRAKLSNAWVEKRLGVATNRNAKVLREIAAKWC